MRRALFAAVLAYLLIFFGLLFGRGILLAMALPALLYLLVGLWRAPSGVDLEIVRLLSAERLQAGEEAEVTLMATNRGAALERVQFEDILPAGLEVTSGSLSHLAFLAAGQTTRWTYRVRGRRGYYALRQVRVTAAEALGAFASGISIQTEGQLFFLPPVLRLRRVDIRPRRTRVYSGAIPARQGGPGVEFFDVREYQRGDSPRQINWRLTARHPEGLFANQYEQERVVDVGIILDGRLRTNEFGGRSIFEHSVLAAAALAEAFLAAGNRVGMLFYGRHIHWTMPGYGKVQGERILHDLSRLDAGEGQVLQELYIPRRLFPAFSQLVVITPLTGDDFAPLVEMRWRGYSVLVISPDPVAFELEGLTPSPAVKLAGRIAHMQRQVLMRRLRGAGIHVVDWDVARPFEQVARGALERRQIMLRGLR